MEVPCPHADRIGVPVGHMDVTGPEALRWKVARVSTTARPCLVTAAMGQRESFIAGAHG
jgi:hypothetical protein